jgi:hypothetical protein
MYIDKLYESLERVVEISIWEEDMKVYRDIVIIFYI